MSILSQIAPRDPGWMRSIDIAATTTVELPLTALAETIGDAADGHPRAVAAESLMRILLCDEAGDDVAIARLEAALDEYVDVWTPALHTSSRFELTSVMVDLDDAIGNVSIAITESASNRSSALLAWQATGRFERPAFLDDDHLLEPNGAVIRLAGATSVSFGPEGRAVRIRCYYDRLSLVEQMMSSIPQPTR